MIIKNAKVFIDGEFRDVDVLCDEKQILEIKKGITKEGEEIIDGEGQYLYAGFLDMHMHGGFFRSCFPSEYDEIPWRGAEDIRYISKKLPEHGVTSYACTFSTTTLENNRAAVLGIREARKNYEGAEPFKIHFEGPFNNPANMGSMNPDSVSSPTKENALYITDNDFSDVIMICMAPELPGAYEFIEWLTKQGVKVELGYTVCTSEQIKKACDAGASQTTHFYNGYEAMHHRKDGPVVGCLLEDRLKYQITCDGYHVKPAWIRLLINFKGVDNVYGITDMNHFSGSKDGDFPHAYFKSVHIHDGLITVGDKGTLKGSNNTFDEIMKRARDICGLSFMEVAKIYGENPAKCLGITDRGKIEVGRKSDFCLMDYDYNVLKTIINGKVYYEKNRD